ncbi:YcxB family protein [Candidatus Stoquefichus massiliensis]|uniref:YcxB family protein n=1 Tax=Candidatus Stoquefichus massiliensis TaxID=1470350 RepID=UPI0004849085|nr:YcxB family protein [Candidatus Stoquefichus massiliensis]
MKRIQITHNIVTKDILKELKWHRISPWQKYMLLLTSIIAAVISIFNFMHQDYLFGAILIALAILCLFEIYWLDEKKYKNIIETMQEETNKEENTYTLIFGSDALTIRNCDMATDNKMPYEQIKRILETKSTYTLFGKKNQFAIIRKDALKIKENELFDFLKNKETKIKKWPND